MIRGENEADASPIVLRHVALLYLQRQAWAAAEDPNRLADVLGWALDTPANRQMLAKILTNLGRSEPPTPTESNRCTKSS